MESEGEFPEKEKGGRRIIRSTPSVKARWPVHAEKKRASGNQHPKKWGGWATWEGRGGRRN